MFLVVEKYFFWLIVYSIIGWIYESFICSIANRRLINRGFLNGPYCPIYGFGAIIDIIILGKIENPILLFFAGMFLTCSLEYFTSYIMEKLFHARWWDYSNKKFNIAGRVCLLGAVVFGAFSVILIKILHPIMINFTNKIPRVIFHITTGTMFVIFISDIVVTLRGFAGFNKILAELSLSLSKAHEDARNKLHSSHVFEHINEIHENFEKRVNAQQSRMLKAFPHFHSVKHDEALKEFRKFIEEKKQKADELKKRIKEEKKRRENK